MLPAGYLDEVELIMCLVWGILIHCVDQYPASAPEDGRNYRPKHVELIGIINKPLLLHLVGCLYYCISDARSYKHQIKRIV